MTADEASRHPWLDDDSEENRDTNGLFFPSNLSLADDIVML
jgi:hypothetical protein